MVGLCEDGNEPPGSLKASNQTYSQINGGVFFTSGELLSSVLPDFRRLLSYLEQTANRTVFSWEDAIEALLMEVNQSALAKVTEDNWRKTCEHVEKVEQFYWEKDGLVDEISDRFVINLDDTDKELSGEEE
ncbi:hypothetical protein ANN_26467 [Periplaneta americana]|uniref:Uncharacterized protein n=1 Tax=Periplaneta americana TaxID=6978 RepID=A0ABQ8RY99_PERAM|nr:hypothetical protein ANN_26467 [Periplaneta americana]